MGLFQLNKHEQWHNTGVSGDVNLKDVENIVHSKHKNYECWRVGMAEGIPSKIVKNNLTYGAYQ